jgi:membrane protease YdiL (CAAX protease family)
MKDQPTTEPPSSGPPPSGAGPRPFGAWRAAKIFLAFLGIQVVVAVVGAVRTFLRRGEGVRFPPSAGGTAPPELLVDALGAALVGTLLSALCVVILLRGAFGRPGGDVARVDVGWLPASRRAAGLAGLSGLGLAAAYVTLAGLAHLRPDGAGPLARAAEAGGTPRVLWAALALVAPPIEELMFRGVLYGGLARSWGKRAAAATTTLLFVALHGPEIGGFALGWVVIGALALLALRARVATGSLVPATAAHAGYNLGLVLVAFAR